MAKRKRTSGTNQEGGGYKDVYRQVFDILKKDPTIWILFSILAILDVIALTCLFLAHSQPFSVVLAPVIRTFYSDKFLHYPANFILLPKIFNHAHLIITSFIGVIVTGVVIKKIEAHVRGAAPMTTFEAGKSVLRRYFAVLVAWIFSYGLFRIVFGYSLPLFGHNIVMFLAGAFLIGLCLQSIVVFLLPAILIKDLSLLKGIGEGLKFGIRNLPMAALIISIPMAMIVALSFVKMLTPLWIQIFPEMILGILFFGIILMTAVDLIITSSATVLYLKVRN